MTLHRSRAVSAFAAGASLVVVPCFAGESSSQDAAPTEREKQLEKRVEDLEKQLSEVNRRLAQSGSNAAGDELEQRVAELEKVTRKDKDGLFAYWSNGIRMDSAGGEFKLKIGGRIQSDWAWFNHTSEAEAALPPLPGGAKQQIEAGSEFRRVRLYVGGTIYHNVDFMNEVDFAGGTVALRNCWIALRNADYGTLQVGNMKEPIGTEELTEDLFTTFLERSTGDEAFAPSFKSGFQYSNVFLENRVSTQIGMYRDSVTNAGTNNGNDLSNNRSGEYNFTGRVAGRPWVDEDAHRYLHLGMAGSLRAPSDDLVQYRSRPEMHLAPRFVDTGVLNADEVKLLELDSGFVAGPFWVFGDYYDVTTDRVDASSVRFSAWQLMAGFFLTGESKPYKTTNSTFDRIKPKSNFDGKGGLGAWELAARWSNLNLNDKDVEGGELDTWTVGIGWYLNPNTRWMLDFVHTDQQDLDVSINGIMMRFQVDF